MTLKKIKEPAEYAKSKSTKISTKSKARIPKNIKEEVAKKCEE